MAQLARFGVFELDLESGELRKQGVRVRLQGKSFLLLKSLLEHSGEAVTREQLQRTLWPAGTFVEADSGLNTAANRLRVTLGDSADVPRYIETLARTGYRFIAPVEIVEAETPAGRPVTGARPVSGRPWLMVAVLAGLTVLISATIIAIRPPRQAGFQYRQLTFRHGQVAGARFAPDGHTILYTAAWGGEPRRLYLTNPYGPESRVLGVDDSRLVAVSRSGELALLSSDGNSPISGGELARVPMNGGAPVTVDRNIMTADWSPDGRLAVVRATGGMNHLEFPVGHPLHQTAGWISAVRFSPSGDRIAFIEHPVRHDNRGTIRVIEPGHAPHSLTPEWSNAGGLAWNPRTNDVWFTASRDGEPKSLWSVSNAGDVRPVAQIAGAMTLRDVTDDGRALMTRDTEQLEMALVDGDSPPHDLSWLDWSRVVDISKDGDLILFDESGVAAGARYRIYLTQRDTGATMLLGDGRALALSPDGRFALTLDATRLTQLRLLPIGQAEAAKPADIAPSGLEYQWARYLPDGQRLLALANEPHGPLRLFVQPLGAKPFPITPPLVTRNVAVSPSGDRVAVLPDKGTLTIYDTSGSAAAREIATPERLAPLLWTDDWLYVEHIGAYTEIPTRVSRLRLADGHLETVRDLRPLETLGVNAITKVMLAPDARTIVFNYRRVLSELFIAEPTSTPRTEHLTAGW
jgi:DNA-binding winged helix-turn-helix (wHTH) protein/WD40 repeat protein